MTGARVTHGGPVLGPICVKMISSLDRQGQSPNLMGDISTRPAGPSPQKPTQIIARMRLRDAIGAMEDATTELRVAFERYCAAFPDNEFTLSARLSSPVDLPDGGRADDGASNPAHIIGSGSPCAVASSAGGVDGVASTPAPSAPLGAGLPAHLAAFYSNLENR